METFAHHQHRTLPTILAGLFALATLLVATPAHASRIPSDPLAFVPAPTQVSRMVSDAHATNVQAALESFWSDISGR